MSYIVQPHFSFAGKLVRFVNQIIFGALAKDSFGLQKRQMFELASIILFNQCIWSGIDWIVLWFYTFAHKTISVH